MIWQGLLYGQVVCLFNTAGAIFSSLLVECGIKAPLYQLLYFYVGVFLVFGTLLIRSTAKGATFVDLRRAARISIASVPDSQGTFLMIMSFSYTSITSVTVLMQSSFVMVAAMSYVFNGKRYSLKQYLGLFGCLCGMAVLVLADLKEENWTFDGSVLGDCMTIAGTFAYSM